MVAYTKPQQRKKEESERLGGERDQIKFIDLRFERWQVVGLRKARRRQDVWYGIGLIQILTTNTKLKHTSNINHVY